MRAKHGQLIVTRFEKSAGVHARQRSRLLSRSSLKSGAELCRQHQLKNSKPNYKAAGCQATRGLCLPTVPSDTDSCLSEHRAVTALAMLMG